MDVRHIAKLAHLQITDEEVELYSKQMDSIVKYVEQLNELEIGDVAPMLGGMTDEGRETITLRKDVAGDSFGQSAALNEAPSSVAGHFQVPKVL